MFFGKFLFPFATHEVLPDDFIDEVFFTKYFIHEYFDVVSNVIVKMYIDAGTLAHDAFDGDEVFVHPVEVSLFVPYVAIHFFLEGFQLFYIEFFFALLYGFCHFGVATNIHFLGIVGTGGKGRVDIDEVDFDALLFQVGTSRQAFSPQQHVATVVFAPHMLYLLHFIERHSPLYMFNDDVVVSVGEHPPRPHKVVQQSLPLQGVRIIWYVFYCH